jgi:hypothetical protein
LDLRRLSTLVPSPAPTAFIVPDVSGLVGTALVKKIRWLAFRITVTLGDLGRHMFTLAQAKQK